MAESEVILVTGCASGIGKALAQDLHKRHSKTGKPLYKVYASDYRVEPMSELEAQGIKVLELDVTKKESIQKAVGVILEENQRIDALVCNAGLAGRGFISEMDYSIVERTFAVNVHGTFKVVQAVVPHMIARRSGKVAVVCSVNSYLAHPFVAPYVGSKAAVLNMTEALAMELRPFGIHVTSIIPGYVKSNIRQNALSESEKYSLPESAYHGYYKGLQGFRERTQDKGISSELAAKHIGDGLSKIKPSRFLCTGSEYRMVLIFAFIQHWISNSYIAWRCRGIFGLSAPYVPYVAGDNAANINGAEVQLRSKAPSHLLKKAE